MLLARAVWGAEAQRLVENLLSHMQGLPGWRARALAMKTLALVRKVFNTSKQMIHNGCYRLYPASVLGLVRDGARLCAFVCLNSWNQVSVSPVFVSLS